MSCPCKESSKAIPPQITPRKTPALIAPKMIKVIKKVLVFDILENLETTTTNASCKPINPINPTLYAAKLSELLNKKYKAKPEHNIGIVQR